MELIFLDSNFDEIHVLDSYKSLIWTDRYWEAGDFDLVCDPSVLQFLPSTSYFRIEESESNMVLETIGIETDIEDGNQLILKGRSLESILDRRIVWLGTALTGNFQTGVIRLLNESIISPTDTDRTISNFIAITSSDPAITSLTIETQFVGVNIYSAIRALCESKGVGFKVRRNLSTDNFEFSLYAGKDRSYGQSTNPYVAFTAALENLLNSTYAESSINQKTVCLVAGEKGVGNVQLTTEVDAPGGGLTGLNRREMYLEANVTRNSPDGELTDSEYLLQLEGKGDEELAKRIYLKAFDGEVDTTMYQFGVHYEMGDILQIADDYDHSNESRVIEMIYSQDNEGYKTYPIFQPVD